MNRCLSGLAGVLLAVGVSGCSSDPDIENPSPLSASVPIEYPLELWDRGAKTLKFSPARQDGKRIEVWAQVPVHFSKKLRP